MIIVYGEEITNERELVRGERLLCRACSEPVYYVMTESELLVFDGAAVIRQGINKQTAHTQKKIAAKDPG